jgi:hypothetical protein
MPSHLSLLLLRQVLLLRARLLGCCARTGRIQTLQRLLLALLRRPQRVQLVLL